MKRDMELIRKLAFKIEESEAAIQSSQINIDDATPDQISYHCALMIDSELINVTDISCQQSPEWGEFFIHRLTSKGHDFIDSARNETLWNKSIARIKDSVGSVALEVLTQYLKSQAKAVLGIGE